jgi:dienelactone hydrolase
VGNVAEVAEIGLMRGLMLAWCCTYAGLTMLGGNATAAEPRRTGPWDVPRILAAETPVQIDEQGDTGRCRLTALRYRSEPYEGHETQVFAYYAVPKELGEAPEKLPAMLLVHGGGGRAFAPWAELWAARGYAALAMDLAGNGADGKPIEQGGPSQDDGSKFRPVAESEIQDTWPYQAVAAVLRGHNLLAHRPEVDARRIGITGISWGGYLTCIVAGIDHQLKVAVPVYGCGFLADNSAWEDRGVFERLPEDARRVWLQNFDPSRYLANVRCPILFVNGTNDFAYPLDSYQKSYQLVSAPRTLCVTVNMPHGHEAGWAPAEIGAFVDSVLKSEPPLANLSDMQIEGNHAQAEWRAAKITRAELHYTTDVGAWQERRWNTVPAAVDPERHTISGEVPAERPLTCFLTAVDERLTHPQFGIWSLEA